MLDKDPVCPGARNYRCLDVVFAVLGDDVRPDDACELRDVEEANRKDDDHQRVTEHRYEHGCKCNAREGHDDVHDAHRHFGSGLVGDCCEGADYGPYDQREQRGSEADDQ